MLIKAALFTAGVPVKKSRLLICAFCGALFALLYPLLGMNSPITVAVKIVMGLVLSCFAVPDISFKKLRNCFVFFMLYTFLLGGAIVGGANLFGIDYSTEFCIATVFVPAYLLMKIFYDGVKFLLRRRNVASFIASVVIEKEGVSVKANGFFDTGNGVYTEGTPVNFCSVSIAEKFFKDAKSFSQIKKIKITTVTGESEKIFFTADKITIYYGKKTNIFYNAGLAVSKEGFSSEYDLILHPALMEVDNERFDFKSKKVS